MSRAAVTYPNKNKLNQMSIAELNAYIGSLRSRLSISSSGPVHKALSKYLKVAEKVRELKRARDVAGDA